MVKNNDGYDWSDVETLLDSDLDSFDGELGELYDEIQRYAITADVIEQDDRYDDADYYRELAVESYKSFAQVIQLQKEDLDE